MKKKLIRADSLLEQIKCPYVEYPIMIGIRKAIKEMIDEAPEIEAIPVELIYKIRNLYLKNDCIISAGVCNEILNMWGKENG